MRHVLILDDNPAFADNLSEVLQDEGYATHVALCAQDALEAARQRPFDVLLCDMRMPGTDGAEALRQLRHLDPGLAAIAVTAHADTELLERATRLGVIAVLPKPPHIPTLLQLVRRARRDGVVIVVDDDYALAENLSELLQLRGFAPVAAHSLPEVEQLAPVRPLAALVDLRVPGGSDGAALERVRERFPSMPVLVMTGHDDMAYEPNEPIWHKPFAPAGLLETLARLNDERRKAG